MAYFPEPYHPFGVWIRLCFAGYNRCIPSGLNYRELQLLHPFGIDTTNLAIKKPLLGEGLEAERAGFEYHLLNGDPEPSTGYKIQVSPRNLDFVLVAERAGFEPANLFGLHAFQACALSRATRPLRVQAGGIIVHLLLSGNAHFTGNVTITVNPLPGSLSARICPPWARTMDLAMARPRPEPPSSRRRDTSAR